MRLQVACAVLFLSATVLFGVWMCSRDTHDIIELPQQQDVVELNLSPCHIPPSLKCWEYRTMQNTANLHAT